MIYSKMDHVFNSKICLVSHSGDKKTKNEKRLLWRLEKEDLIKLNWLKNCLTAKNFSADICCINHASIGWIREADKHISLI